MKQKIVLLDRDGTVIVEPPTFNVKLSSLELLPDALLALRTLAEAGCSVIFVTNQMSIANGTLTLQEYFETEKKLLELIQPTGINVLKTYFCPHGPDDGCYCRKPKPKLLIQAAAEFNFNLSDTYMVGDRVTDVEAGLAAGTKTILLRQGLFNEETDRATYIADNLLEAVKYIVDH